MVTKPTIEYLSLTNDYRTGQRYGQENRDQDGVVQVSTPVECFIAH